MKRLLLACILLTLATCILTFACSGRIPHAITSDAALPMSGKSTLSGTVTDDQGLPLPGVTVTIAGAAGTRTTVSDAQGRFRFEHVPDGSYIVSSGLSGFTTTKSPVTVSAGNDLNVTQRLKPGKSESITVTADAAATAPPVTAAYPAPPPFPAAAKTTAAEAITVSSANFGVAGGVIGGRIDNIGAHPQFAHFDEHAFIESKRQPVTTFAIDVDHASYSIVRRYLSENVAPPPDAVRIEEMVNYFTYSYPTPAGTDPFSVTTEVAGCPWNSNHRVVRIGIQGQNLDEWKMAPNNLVFLLDVSGSMMPPPRLPLIKSAFRLLVNQLRAEDSVAIVVYAGAAGLVLPPTSGADKATILTAIDSLQAGGSTAGGAGIELAYKAAQDNFKRDGNNRVILATDGDFNVGVRSIAELQKLIEEKRKSGIFLSTIGVGDDNYRDDMLEMLADRGNGNYNYLDSMREAEKVFKHDLTGTLVTIAKDVKVQVEFDPSRVASYRQIGYEKRALQNSDFDDDTKDAGELGAGHSVTALYEIEPAPGSSNGPIAAIRLRYKQPHGDTSRLMTSRIVDHGANAWEASPDMQFAMAVAEFGMLLRDSPHKGTASYADVAALARATRGTDMEGYREELLRMIDTSTALSRGRAVAAKN